MTTWISCGAASARKVDHANADHWVNLGIANARSGRYEAAISAFDQAIVADPTRADAHLHLANTLYHAERLDEAIVSLQRALELRPDVAEVHAALGQFLMLAEKWEKAAEIFRQAIRQHPQTGHLHARHGAALIGLKQLTAAVEAYGTAAMLEPAHAAEWLSEANHKIGLSLQEQGKLEEAASAYQQAIALRPDWAAPHNELGLALQCLCRYEEAIASFERAICLSPDLSAAYSNLGNLRRTLGDLDGARLLHDEAVARDPSNAVFRYNRSLMLLMDGDFAAGFADYECRRRGAQRLFGPITHQIPEWTGEPLHGRTILLFAEQGLGDAIHFLRFVWPVREMGADIILRVPESLVALFRAAAPFLRIISPKDPVPRFDYHLPLMSLPWRLGTTLETIPTQVPYLVADPTRVAAWHQRFAERSGLRVGFVWSGNPGTRHDRARSVPLAALLGQIVVEGAALYSLRKEPCRDDAERLVAMGGVVTDLSAFLVDFSETAAIVSALDLVISVDTSVAHLAGALAKPTWTILHYALDWRWLRDRSDSPWYPTMRLFRQVKPGIWDDPLCSLGEALKAEVAKREPA